jgi:hypothetical protein
MKRTLATLVVTFGAIALGAAVTFAVSGVQF